jgi:hypothetical protein
MPTSFAIALLVIVVASTANTAAGYWQEGSALVWWPAITGAVAIVVLLVLAGRWRRS